jgi:hypothetical protein
MNEERFNMSIRTYLKTVGVRSQHAIEQAVAQALAEGRLRGDEKLPAKMTLTLGGTDLTVVFDGEIGLE